jgi:UDP-glucose 4-epimerase
MKNVLVTGGAGFIGSALVRGLLAEEGVERVVIVDNLLTGNRSNLAGLQGNIEFHEADIRDARAIELAMNGIDTVFHEAASPSVPRSIKEPELSHDVNVNGTFNVFLAAHRRGVKRVVYAASSSAYGDTETLPKVETMTPQPKSPYAVQKLLGEYYARTFFEVYGLETVCLRYFNVFGPHQDPASPYSGVLSIFCTSILAGEVPTIFGDGEQTRDFTYIDNIVRLNMLAARAAGAPGNVYNGGIGGRYSLNETWSALNKIAGTDIAAAHGAARDGDVRDSQADLTVARQDLGYEPVVKFTEGLRRTLDWYRTQQA